MNKESIIKRIHLELKTCKNIELEKYEKDFTDGFYVGVAEVLDIETKKLIGNDKKKSAWGVGYKYGIESTKKIMQELTDGIFNNEK